MRSASSVLCLIAVIRWDVFRWPCNLQRTTITYSASCSIPLWQIYFATLHSPHIRRYPMGSRSRVYKVRPGINLAYCKHYANMQESYQLQLHTFGVNVGNWEFCFGMGSAICKRAAKHKRVIPPTPSSQDRWDIVARCLFRYVYYSGFFLLCGAYPHIGGCRRCMQT